MSTPVDVFFTPVVPTVVPSRRCVSSPKTRLEAEKAVLAKGLRELQRSLVICSQVLFFSPRNSLEDSLEEIGRMGRN